jgi:DNA-binding beta-propeller fold protein YncE
VDVFDPAKRRVIAQVKGMADPHGIAVDEQAGRVYVANSGDKTLAVISTADWNVVDTVQLQHSPDGLLFVPELGTLYIANSRDSSLSALKRGAHNTRTVDLNGAPEDMAFDPQRRLLFVTLQDASEVIALNSNLGLAKQFRLAASQPTGIAIDLKTSHVFVAVRYAVLVLEADTGREIARVPAAAGVDQLWFDDSTRTLYAAANGGIVNMIKQQSGKYYSEQEFSTSVRGHSVAFDPARNLVYLPGGFEGRSKLVILKRVETAPEPATTKAALR